MQISALCASFYFVHMCRFAHLQICAFLHLEKYLRCRFAHFVHDGLFFAHLHTFVHMKFAHFVQKCFANMCAKVFASSERL